MMDKRRLKEAYFKYTFLLYKERYDLPLNICGNIDEALDREFLSMYEKFNKITLSILVKLSDATIA